MKSYWNHRVFRDDDGNFSIKEAHYQEGDALPCLWTEDAIGVTGDSVDDLRQQLQWMMECLSKPVLVAVPHGDGTFHAEEAKP